MKNEYIGTKVEITDPDQTYARYKSMSDVMNVTHSYWEYGYVPSKNDKGVIVDIKPHLSDPDELVYLVQSLKETRQYMITTKGFKFIDEQADPYAELKQAAWDGKTIQILRIDDTWTDARTTPAFNLDVEYYRIKPEEQNTASESDPISATTLLQDCMDVQLERGKQYDGNAKQERSFKRVAMAYNAITHRDLNGSDIALILQILKDVRMYTNMDQLHEDSVLDKISYASLHGEELYAEFTEKDNQK